MKSNVVAVVLLLACLGLGVVLWQQDKKHTEQTENLDRVVTSYSNQVTTLDSKYHEQIIVNATLETNLAATLLKSSNDLAAVEATLSSTTADLKKSQTDAAAAAAAAQAEIEEKDKKITALENQNTELDKQSNDLKGSITNLQTQIEATQKKLDASEGDRVLLTKELHDLQAKKDQLEKELSDLAFLKETVKKMKEELSVARRLDWIRRGLYDAMGQKGGERLIHPLPSVPPATNNPLEVEIGQDGSVKITPAAPSTNAPSVIIPPPK